MNRLFFLFFLLICSLEGAEVSDILKTIPPKDRQKIEKVFTYLVQRDSLGYVLFGETKPAAICSIPIACKYALIPPSFVEGPFFKYQNSLKQCWAIWKHYEGRFKHANLIVCEEHNRFKSSSFLQLIFINKPRLKQLLEQYEEDFIQVLGANFSPEEFIARLEQKKQLRPLIRHDEKLLGLILGFGKESAEAFKNNDLSETADHPLGYAFYRPPNCSITLVSFRGNPESKEVQELLEAYTKEIPVIEEALKSDSFLVSLLEKFCCF